VSEPATETSSPRNEHHSHTADSESETLMEIIEETSDGTVVERRIDLHVDGTVVPGIHWLPVGAAGPHATVCIGHGGFQHKRVENVLELARQLVANLGVGVVALDAPEHGDRVTDPDATARALAAATKGRSRRDAMDDKVLAAMAKRAVVHIAEWKALLDDLQTNEQWAAGPFGWWGVSMGTTHGLPIAAADGRIAAAVFGLNALRPGDERWAAQAAAVTIPVLFLNQWDDELMTREAALALWDTLGSKEKTMHINPGGHVKVPRFERQASEDFFRRHLLPRA
jgi:dienelactone hydrolase